ncbi:hypothetical protein MKW98_006496 [Papaver atlanticum]|uniref:Uncharacterized protein n=1 Tax=Papaver atlanticum TaxID=357466 RepID=A0AAD4X6L1_9MAGN|nr:hypothetical protein MKW98_006496 [Papaver atlanticum]
MGRKMSKLCVVKDRALGPIALLTWSIVSGRSCRGQGRNRKGNMAKLREWFRKKFLQYDRCLLAFGNTTHVLCSIIEETLVEKMNTFGQNVTLIQEIKKRALYTLGSDCYL